MTQAKAIFENDRFELYADKNGKFWLWNKVEEINHAIRAKSEIEAYRLAVDSLIYFADMQKTRRMELSARLEKVAACFIAVFPEYVEPE